MEGVLVIPASLLAWMMVYDFSAGSEKIWVILVLKQVRGKEISTQNGSILLN